MSPINKVIINKKTDVNPIWIMRQAGRYLPEFREIRKKNTDFIKLCLNKNLSSEITLQPLKRFDLEDENNDEVYELIEELEIKEKNLEVEKQKRIKLETQLAQIKEKQKQEKKKKPAFHRKILAFGAPGLGFRV